MKTTRLFLVLCVCASARVATAAEKPTVYNRVDGERSALDQQVHALLASKFTIVDLRDSKEYVQPKATAGHFPRVARTATGEAVGGTVMVAYVVTVEGRVAEPVVVKASDPRLRGIATEAMQGWRFKPATHQGVAIATTAVQEFAFETAPTKFVEQKLEPTGGKISRPADWFYAERHRGPTYDWAITRENTAGGKPYTTGINIQTFTDVKKGTGKTAQQFILDFAAAKKKAAAKVIDTCEPKDQRLFTRICLETEEGPYRILYSLFWGRDGLDVAVITIAGTTKELWEIYAPTFDKMNAFELIDMTRF